MFVGKCHRRDLNKNKEETKNKQWNMRKI